MTMRGPMRSGPQLPYDVIAGIVPSRRGWLTATAKSHGATIAPEEPQVLSTFTEVLDYKPAYRVIAVALPIGLPDEPSPGGRACEHEARRLLGLPRSNAIASTPTRAALSCDDYEQAALANGGGLSPIRWRQRRRILEIDDAIAPYWQRTVFEVHPELTFFQLNADAPLRLRKRTPLGSEERKELLVQRLPGVERLLDASLPGVYRYQLYDAAACLWTARRILARAVARLPEHPEWNNLGLRMEIVR